MADEMKLVRDFVRKRIGELTHSSNDAAVRAKLARLRRGLGCAPGSMPELWDVTLEGMPEELYSKDGAPTKGEWAAHTALTLFALHQQGKDMKTKPMNAEGASLGASIRRLVKSGEDDARIKRRFDAAVTANSPAEFAHHLRGLVQLLKSENIPLDYPALAAEMVLFQTNGARDSVRLRWGQDFYRMIRAEEKATQDTASNIEK
ncbi:MAG: type I-E CRISPR-associated protein Cse2/CasB [Clostridia bacterium]|nr:type I-E CRISPR-associated protein Cse2/CasB [Clostridia bacterium]